MHVREGDLSRDRRLVELHQAGGGTDAFVELYQLHYPRLVRFCGRSLGSDAHLAEDIAQEAFTRALKGLDSFGGERLFYPWLVVIARRLVAMHFRRTKRRVMAYERAHAAAPLTAAGPEDDVVDRVTDEAARVRAVEALDRVPERYREVIRLRELEQLSYAEIAQRMQITPAAVAPLLHRARTSLRNEFDALAPQDVTRAALGPLIALWAGVRRIRDRGLQWASALPDPGVVGVPLAVGVMSLGALLLPAVPHHLDDRSLGLATLSDRAVASDGDDGAVAITSDTHVNSAGPPGDQASPATAVRLPSSDTRIGHGMVHDDRLRNGAASVSTGEAGHRHHDRSRDMPERHQVGPIWWTFDPHQAEQFLRELSP